MRRRRIVGEHAKTVIIGTEDQGGERLEELIARTGADEVMSTAFTFDTAAPDESDARKPRLLGIEAGPPATGY
ncbi:hypothetical protein MCHIJ_39460 [Mycolicibacterium chitae]|uniref:Uncharacterized protein n=1 Tax=Mycolicibacterium chitae TaxID=1792 RepID=A0A448I6J9_MYCCI|nr:hypothetical protein [Mycolicibacterium chitae]MCV7108102.1 hypothetical protein [Mycolicibacterium chitae]BBZ04509.1 hypothetical protein MCHIJ_39460 [Mycolicibacterium chitae]VEG48141.1 Uncharacterised protein [Mycolicibacterium chitae]